MTGVKIKDQTLMDDTFVLSYHLLSRLENSVAAMTVEYGSVSVFVDGHKIRVFSTEGDNADFFMRYKPDTLVGVYTEPAKRYILREDVGATIQSLGVHFIDESKKHHNKRT